ncbi:hypothetical protein PR048_020008 [Dryococelus australis]|uniref:Uncharacterized protein n=1 Tax=Dryococelus australis TaxID=614101 RepID=A0ABQ9H572_9NEOP|nr:hypothetical protein PR048_020008 [Dryococelus australis]
MTLISFTRQGRRIRFIQNSCAHIKHAVRTSVGQRMHSARTRRQPPPPPPIAAVKSKVDTGYKIGYIIDPDGLLYKFHEDNRNYMLVVPGTMQNKVLTTYHN